MKKKHVLGILFFSGLWGLSEAKLGGLLYIAGLQDYAAIPLTAVALIILTIARAYLPQLGTATLIAACAMLYKFLNTPFFACHFLGILLTGVCYDLAFGVFRIKSRALSAVAAVYMSYALFAVLITYIFRYEYWVQAGMDKVLYHIGVSGTLTAVVCAVLVPLSFRLGEQIKVRLASPFDLRPQWAPGSVSLITAGLWVLGLAAFIPQIF